MPPDDPGAHSAKIFPLLQDDDASEAVPPALSDDALALEFTARHGDELRYVSM
jgi:hypothetical protein